MGKTRKSRKRVEKDNPTGLPSVRDVEKEELEAGESSIVSKHETAIPTLLDYLGSPDVENRLFGLQTLASTYNTPTPVVEVIEHRVVRVAAPLLMDPNPAIRHSAAGALRNLSATGRVEICDLLIEEDIMTPLIALIQKYGGNWKPKQLQEVDTETDTLIQAVHLLWNLCESNSTAVKHFNNANLLPVLVKCLDKDLFGLELAVSVAQCLQTVTEENPVAVNQFHSSEPLVLKLFQSEDTEPGIIHLRILAAGLLLNLSYGKITCLQPAIVTKLMMVLSGTLHQSISQQLNELTSVVPLDEDYSTDEEVKVKNERLYESSLQGALHLLDAQQTALEILTNITSGDDSDEPMDQDSSSDDVLSDSGCMDDEVDASAITETPLNILPEVYECIVSHTIIDKILSKTVYPAENVLNILKERRETSNFMEKLSSLRCRALLCLSNLLSAIDICDLGGPSEVYGLWMKIGNIVFKEAAPNDTKLLEAGTAAMRAALQKLAESKAQCFGNFSDADLQLMFNGVQQCSDAAVRSNLIRIIGILGMALFAQPNIPSQLFLKNIGKFLLDTCSKEGELWVVAEALDTLMDVFSEDETDAAAAEIHLVDKLKTMVPVLKYKLKSQRKRLGEHYLVVTTVNANLMRFIKYKGGRLQSHHGSVQQNGH